MKKNDSTIDVDSLQKAYVKFLKIYGDYCTIDKSFDGILGEFLREKPDYKKLLADARLNVFLPKFDKSNKITLTSD